MAALEQDEGTQDHDSLFLRQLFKGAQSSTEGAANEGRTWLFCFEGEGDALDWPMKFEVESADGEVLDCAVTEHSVDLVEDAEHCRIVPYMGELEAEVGAHLKDE